jgi:hypothetical protein
MNKINSLLLTVSLLILSSAGFAAQTDNDRYKEILAAYETNNLNPNFLKAGDIDLIAQRQESLRTKLNSYKASWMPAILKTIAIGFGIDAAGSSLRSVMFLSPNAFFNTLKTLSFHINDAIYPISHPRSLLTQQATDPLISQLRTWRNQKKISLTAYAGGLSTVYAGVALFSAGIATYLFKKANSYHKEIERLEKEIDLTTNMLKLLMLGY